ncbi:hypothetical protein [Nonomuraea dietziae]|uniref:hypothetical protein n=1 Tax=Nonomuraea dietziae TaxID=65515 RepID=UPI003404E363
MDGDKIFSGQTAGSPRRALGAGPLDPLVDALVHGQDAARALGRVREMPEGPVMAALEHVHDSSFHGARERFHGTRLVASNLDWSAGDLLLLATGRRTGPAALSGSGAQRIAAGLGGR